MSVFGTTIHSSVRFQSIVIVRYKRVSVNNLWFASFVHLIDSEDVYLSPNASSRNWSTSGQFSSSSANACNIGGSSGQTKSVILVCPGLAFVPAIPAAN